MTRQLFILTVSLALTACKNSDSVVNEAHSVDSISKPDSIIQMQVELIDKLDTIKLVGYCGVIKFDMTFKYKVIKVIGGNYNDSTILINQICPTEAIQYKWMQNNTIYTYKLKRRKTIRQVIVGQKTELVDAGDYEIISDTTKHIGKASTPDKLSFKNIAEVIQAKRSYPWVNLNLHDSSASLALHFNLITTDTLEVEYSAECWLYFPYTVSSDKITVYWDKIIDTKYDFDIVKAINKTDGKYIGKPFMTLQLINDTTLQATYLLPQLIKKINSSTKDRLFFPDKYFVSTKHFP